MKLTWTELAIEKLEEYADYIALDKPLAALKWTETIQKSVRKLKRFPRIGREVPEIKRVDILEIFEGNYRIIYRIESERISILTIRHCKQLLNEKDKNNW
ncbi:type II toxin-antitoxin system RelE/ParE family toxin [candidate division KSB1 bacterium]|nr:type II toxin-antitoxin system RelE/ParE family toxin [candidate division KSB1 bacterium]MBL7092406.1 type II toxin-antitoxin system RelE/ParE family toxin [candidate division KSB1 bacterium]